MKFPLVVVALVLAALAHITNQAHAFPDANGFTDIPPGPYLCVSQLSGNDATGTGTEAKPFATPAKARSVATPGTDIWLDSGTYSGLTNWTLGGTSANPCVVMTWPGRDRAVIDNGFSTKYQTRVDNLWLFDLEIRAGSADYALDFLGSGTNTRVEGCYITGKIGVRLQASPVEARYTSPTFYRTVVENTPNANGMYVQGADGLVVDQCAFVNAGGKGNIRHQSLYVHQSCRNAIIRNSIVAYAGAGGFQHRVGTLMDECFGFNCAIPFQLGHPETSLTMDEGRPNGNPAAFRATGTIRNCVAIGGMDTSAADPRGFAYWFDYGTFTSENNIAVNGGGSQPYAFSNSNGATTTFAGNLGYNWNKAGEPNILGAGVTLGAGNDFRLITKGSVAPASTYPDPNRGPAAYAVTLGLPRTDAAFFGALKAGMSKKGWKRGLLASDINAFVRAGFGRGTDPVPPVVVPPVVPPTIPPIEQTSSVSVAQVGEYVVVVITGKKPTPEQLAKMQAALREILD